MSTSKCQISYAPFIIHAYVDYLFFLDQKMLLESGDSTNSQLNLTEDTSTPCSKLSGKRSAEDMDVSIIDVEKGNLSTTQTKKKATKIKTEKLD
jgi:hypothetical protein